MSDFDLREAFLEYKKQNPNEVDIVSRMQEFLDKTARPFHRENQEGHFTGSAWLIDESGEFVLLTEHRKLQKWLQLGGHADGDSNLLAVALREAVEESGMSQISPVSSGIFDMDIHLIPPRKDEPEHFHYDIRFLLQLKGERTFVRSQESLNLAWLSPREIEPLNVDASVRRMVKKWRALGVG